MLAIVFKQFDIFYFSHGNNVLFNLFTFASIRFFPTDPLSHFFVFWFRETLDTASQFHFMMESFLAQPNRPAVLLCGCSYGAIIHTWWVLSLHTGGDTGLKAVCWLVVGLSGWKNSKDSCPAKTVNWQVKTNIPHLEELTLDGLPRSPPSAYLHMCDTKTFWFLLFLCEGLHSVYHALHLPAVSVMTDGGSVYYLPCGPVYNQSPSALCSIWFEKCACACTRMGAESHSCLRINQPRPLNCQPESKHPPIQTHKSATRTIRLSPNIKKTK